MQMTGWRDNLLGFVTACALTSFYMSVLALCSEVAALQRYGERHLAAIAELALNLAPMPWFVFITAPAVYLLFWEVRRDRERVVWRTACAILSLPVTASMIVAWSYYIDKTAILAERQPPSLTAWIVNMSMAAVIWIGVLCVNRKSKGVTKPKGSDI